MDSLLSPITRTLLAASDHENDTQGHRLTFTETVYDPSFDEMFTYVYVIAVDPATGDWPSVSPPFDVWFSHGLLAIDMTGAAIALFVPDLEGLPDAVGDLVRAGHSTFPNGAEWSRVAGQPVAVYYSARPGGSKAWMYGTPAEIRFAVDQLDGTFSAALGAQFVDAGWDRFLLSCVTSDLLTDDPVESVVVKVEAHPLPLMPVVPGDPLPTQTVAGTTISDTTEVVRMDPEVMKMTGGNFMVYYQQQFPAGGGTFLLPPRWREPRDPAAPSVHVEEVEIRLPTGQTITIRRPVFEPQLVLEPEPTDLTWDQYNQFRRADA